MADDLIERLEGVKLVLAGEGDGLDKLAAAQSVDEALAALRAQPTSPSGVPSDAAVKAAIVKALGHNPDDLQTTERFRDALTAAYAIDRPLASKGEPT